MSYGGVDEVEIDADYGRFYVHREGGYWNAYAMSDEPGFLAWILYYGDQGDIDIYDLRR